MTGLKRRNPTSGFISWSFQAPLSFDAAEGFGPEEGATENTEAPLVCLDGYFLKLQEAKGDQVIWVANISDDRTSPDKPA
ncbi:hypothetical protein ABID16_000153 [Rhizobium aquaticum]|uniref:Uncharacterized protein n=1 Tax=Rhizobium aquaticum TaxID=1549636 RepID=A0ABV2ITN5_9HYPH